MSIFEHARTKIFNPSQHPYQHDASSFGYINPLVPQVTLLSEAMDYLFAVIYPRYIGTFATPANLPVSASANDYAIVTNDGDGRSAGYVWLIIDNAGSWHKRYDMDWSTDGLLSQLLDSTLPMYVHKNGHDDLDASGAVVAGLYGGQHIYGGVSAGTHLTLYANSGDTGGGHTGFVQVDDNFRPAQDSTFSSGTTTERWLKVWTDELTSGTMTITGGSIVDSSGAISFDNENLTTSGTLASGTHTIGTLILAAASVTDSSGSISFDNENLSTSGTLASGTHTIGTLVLAAGSITDTGGNISFDNENLSTSGTLGAGVTTVTQLNVDNLRLDGNTISVTNVDGNLAIGANGTGVINVSSVINLIGTNITGALAVTGSIGIDNLTLDGNTIGSISNNDIIIAPNGSGIISMGASISPVSSSSFSFGDATHLFKNIFFSGDLKDATLTFVHSELFALRNTSFRDAARTQPVQAGDALFWDAVSGTWLASAPDTEIDHGTISGLLDDDHPQYALLAGRVGGQTLNGGNAAGNNLTLESTTNGTKGSIFFSSNASPTTDASYSGGWGGTDLGDSSHNYKDIYSKGVHKGLRFENFTDAARPAASAQNPGRVIWNTDQATIQVDTGGTWAEVGVSKFLSDTSWNGSDLTKTVTVSGDITDARKAIWALYDNANSYERIYAAITASQTQVTITVSVPLPAGTYRLVGIE